MAERLLIYGRNWNCICDIRLNSPMAIAEIEAQLANINLHKSDKNIINGYAVEDSKVLTGILYSLHKILARMLNATSDNSFGFSDITISAECDEFRIDYYESPTKMRFLALLRLNNQAMNGNYLKSFYSNVFVPSICRNPLVLRSSDDVFIVANQTSGLKNIVSKFFARI